MRPYYEDDSVALYHGDSYAVLPALGLEEKGLALSVVTDVPYNLSQPSNGLRELDYGKWDAGFDVGQMLKLVLPLVTGSVYVWCHETQVSEVLWSYRRAGFLDRLLAWVKPNPTVLNGDKIWLPGLEVCAFGKRPRSTFHAFCRPGIWTVTPDQPRLHPNQKPLDVILDQIQASTDPGDTVLDPCAGSGTTLVAAKLAGRRAVGVELEEACCEVAAVRLSQEVLPLTPSSGPSSIPIRSQRPERPERSDGLF